MLSARNRVYQPAFGAGDMVTHDQRYPAPTTSNMALNNVHSDLDSDVRPRFARVNTDDSVADGPDSTENGQYAKASDGSSNPVRRRISRACDQCNQLRTKCDGKIPCAHCVEFGLNCEYVRQRKKRGKASRKDLAAQQAAAAGECRDGASKSGNDDSSNEANIDPQRDERTGLKRKRSGQGIDLPPRQQPITRHVHAQAPSSNGDRSLPSMDHQTGSTHNSMNGESMEHHRSGSMDQISGAGLPTPRLPSVIGSDQSMPVGMGEYGPIDDYHRSILQPGSTNNVLHNNTSMPHTILPGGNMTGYGDGQFPTVPSPGSQAGITGGAFRMGDSPNNFLAQSPMAGSPAGWFSMQSPSVGLYSLPPNAPSIQALRYPVLRPLLPHIASILPVSLACDLLELYFSSTSSAFMLPQSPYVLGYVFRKRSFLRPRQPRICSPALLASMLWVAAQTSESAFLTSPPSARGKVCQKLLELTVGLLRPLIHTDGGASYNGNMVVDGVALGGFGVALPGQSRSIDGASPGAAASLDDVATYIHLATVVSASEYKGASLRWWNAAWSLARELKLGRELSRNPTQAGQDGTGGSEDLRGTNNGQSQLDGGAREPGSEEEREERRRIWWLLYIMDRHLALCYNRPLFLLDVECEALLQPEHDSVWQAGESYPPPNHAENLMYRRPGLGVECTSHGLFGYFLPLMTILGQIVDLHHARNHPRFQLRCAGGETWDAPAAEITAQLEAYGQSLAAFEAQHNNNDGSGDVGGALNTTTPPRLTETALQTRVVRAYGDHLMHTLHILVTCRWDPIALLDDADLWISTASFAQATGHAVAAAEALDSVLEHDPDLSFMPFFFGIYLLQGSFLLLLIADKLQAEASSRVVKACETIVRAHEACVATLNTEYQRNFRKVMRSALAQVRGRMVEGTGSWEQQAKRREVLALYRWTGDGTGLAL
ncbi:Hypothetical protein R9X50_00748800 [Acrodontium crateriforme]|uniref:Zn(2)-C6 fungal-type domain-containing protein n=1 Tax=Acrodontium crateriforme TaxID=150365 RepID=A0AAQ3R7Q6_9PEZI|nr:Hypothetical protein R9X50_00748800 [Acrodontium crateriforme]